MEIVLKRIAKKELIHRQTLSVGRAEFRGAWWWTPASDCINSSTSWKRLATEAKVSGSR